MNNFTEIPFTIKNLDKYYIRTAIFNAIEKTLPQLKGDLLDIGCGKLPYKDYILKNSEVKRYVGLEIENALVYDKNVKPDYTWDGRNMPFESNYFDCAFATEVLEHCPDPRIVLNEVLRVLKPGGIFFFTVPFLWNLHEVPNDEYRYTPFSMERLLRTSGFSEISVVATGGWHASMAQMTGLWLRRAPMNNKLRKILSLFIKPAINCLIKRDKNYTISFKEGQMITGMYGTAKK